MGLFIRKSYRLSVGSNSGGMFGVCLQGIQNYLSCVCPALSTVDPMVFKIFSYRPISLETGQQTSPSVDASYENIVPVSVHPLKVQRPNDPHPRQPTLDECELIIMRLHESNERLQHDVSY